MKLLHIVLSLLVLAGPVASAQSFMIQKAAQPLTTTDGGDDVFIPVSKYIAAGNAEALSAWFADNLEISVLSKESDASRVKTFFDTYTPRSFDISHTAGRANMKYALGTLKAGGETFNVTIFMSCKNDTYRIQQLKIERF